MEMQPSTPTGGDFLKGDGTGSFSIYGDKFPVRQYVVEALVRVLNRYKIRMRILFKNILVRAYSQWYVYSTS